MFFEGAVYQKSQSTVFMLLEKGVLSAVVWTVRRWWLLNITTQTEKQHEMKDVKMKSVKLV